MFLKVFVSKYFLIFNYESNDKVRECHLCLGPFAPKFLVAALTDEFVRPFLQSRSLARRFRETIYWRL